MPPFLFLTSGALAGILCAELFGAVPFWLLICLAICFLVSGVLFLGRPGGFLQCLLLYLGALLAAYLNWEAVTVQPVTREGQEEFCGRIVSEPREEMSYSQKGWFTGLVLDTGREKFRLFLISKSPLGLRRGGKIKGKGKFAPIKGAAAPGCFDAKEYYGRENIYRSASINSGAIIYEPPENGDLREDLRKACAKVLSCPNCPNAAMLQRLILIGTEEKLPKDMQEGLRKCGIAHILAVSGLHVGILGGLFFLGLLLINPQSQAFELLLLPFFWFYAYFLDFCPSVTRAVLLLTFLVVGHAAKKIGKPLHFLMVAAFFYAFIAPRQMLSASALLSYAATFALLGLLPLFREEKGPEKLLRELEASYWARLRHWLWDFFRQSLLISLSVFLFTLPLNLLFFHMATPLAFLMNLPCIPICAMLICTGLAKLILALLPFPVPPLESVWRLSLVSAERLMPWLEKAGQSPLLAFNAREFSSLTVLLYFLSMAFLILAFRACRRHREDRRLFQGLPIRRLQQRTLFRFRLFRFLFLICLYWLFQRAIAIPAYDTGLEITALDVGQGDATFLRQNGKTLLIDCGRSLGGSSMGERVAIPYLRSLGLNRLDLLAISHFDDDHMGGAEYVLKNIRVGKILSPPLLNAETNGLILREQAQKAGIPWQTMAFPSRLSLGGLDLAVIWPQNDILPKDSNSRSLGLLGAYKGHCLLFTGDAPSNTESNQWNNIQKVMGTSLDSSFRLAVYKIPHHGSKHSGSQWFLQKLNPRLSLLSVGKNPYRLPHPSLLRRYEKLDTKIMRTDEDGTVILHLR